MARIVAYMDVGKGREQDAEAFPTILLHFLRPWRSAEVRFHGRNRYDYMDIGGRAMQDAYMDVSGRTTQETKSSYCRESSREQRPRIMSGTVIETTDLSLCKT